ncbi:uncharacterized protein A1O9_10832, partial [Exophiala aquamarina CBS 119918]
QTVTPKERFEAASKHAALLRALYNHPKTVVAKSKRALADRSKMPATLWNVLDFEVSTFEQYLVPLLPPSATKNSKALADAWDYTDPNFKEDEAALADDLYPKMQSAALKEKWSDAAGRTVMITSIILDKPRQILFGGPLDFGPEVEEAARALQ